MVTAFVGAAASTSAPAAAAQPKPAQAAAPTKAVTIGLAEIGQIAPVTALITGFKEEMANEGYVEGDKVTYVEKSAQGDSSIVPLMAKQMVQSSPDLILGAGTPVVVALKQETQSIPILFGGATDPVGTGLVASNDKPGGNLTGTSDYLDPSILIGLVQQVAPQAKRIGILGNPGEQNTAVQIKSITDAASKQNLEVVTAPIASTADILPAVQSLKGRVDAVILPQDNTVGSAYATVGQALMDAKLPIIATTTQRVQDGNALVGVGVDYHQLGVLTARQAVKILSGQAKPADMPVVFGNNPGDGGLTVAVNTSVAQKLGVTLPDSLTQSAKVFQ
jgi:putative ABC transport system substrate-binding protein